MAWAFRRLRWRTGDDRGLEGWHQHAWLARIIRLDAFRRRSAEDWTL